MHGHTLRCEGVSVRYGDRALLRDVSLHVAPGELVALLGRNGAGKSTLMRVLAGVQRSEVGEVRWGDQPSTALRPREAAGLVSWQSQSNEGAESFTVLQVVSFGLFASQSPWATLGAAERARCLAALDEVGIGALADRRVGQLSGGERQRVRFAMALAQQAPIALFDEPSSAQDLDGTRMMMQALRSRAARGAVVVAAVHDLTLALQAFARVVMLDAGTISFDGSPREAVTSGVLSSVFGHSVRTSVDAEGRLWAGVQLDGLDQP